MAKKKSKISKKMTETSTELEQLLKTEEVAKLLGMSQIWLKVARKEKGFPFKRFGKSIRYSPTEIKEWMEKQNEAS